MMARHILAAAAATALVLLCCFHLPATAMMADTIRYGPPRVPHRLGTVIAVDLGNTNSCVAGYGDEADAPPLFRLCIPTSVAFTGDGDALVGEAAKNHPAAISGFKRLLGTRFGSPEVRRAAEHLPYKIVDWCTMAHIEVNAGAGGAARSVYASDVASMVIAELKARAEARLAGGGKKVHNAVVTVPYYFSDGPREAAMNAARMAGLTTVRIIDEPTAAAVSHGLHHGRLRDGGNVLVLHVGGGTSAATVLTYDNAVFEAVASRHDAHLGGDDFDARIAGRFSQLIKRDHGGGVDDIAPAKLKSQCELAKRTLSSHDVAQFEELNHDLFEKVISLVDAAMAEARRAVAGFDVIDEVVLVGGSTKIPRIRELIKNYFAGKEATVKATASIGGGAVVVVEPEEAVVHGGGLLSHPMEDGYHCMGAGGRRQIGSPMDRCYHEF
ncbi:heat shock 70 kDa protein BIP3-like [Oryza sativa Japonica Group]|uniref:heat shock 70 kDa protein BIP3-like n=1 Tax=Oryza sativa subsp. japonica TaxID=39947 RepID=UPI00339CAF12